MKKKLLFNNLIKPEFFNFIEARLFLIILISLFQIKANAQLADFTLQVTKTDESCPGNATLNFQALNTTSGATLNYKVYKLPNLTTPIADLSTNFIGGLSNGTYKIIATQSLPPNSNTQSQEITIANNIADLEFSLSSVDAICGSDGTITVTTTSGTAITYEIMSGPIIRPPQASNIFGNLPAGIYQIRIFDACGEATVETRTIFLNSPQIDFGNALFPDLQLPACDLITAKHTVESPNSTLLYPFQYQFTIFPPNSATPIIINGSVTEGSITETAISQAIPFYHNQPYQYDLKVTDYCGNVYNINNNVVYQKLELVLSTGASECGFYFLNFEIKKYRGPFSIVFTQAPADFNPADFNAIFPGEFYASELSFGDIDNPLPMGDYTIEITDACGRTVSESVTLEYIEVQPVVSPLSSGGCTSSTGNIQIELPNHTIETAIVSSAPSLYSNTLPHNVTNFVTVQEGLELQNIPSGTYIIALTDTCGNDYVVEATITNSTASEIGSNSRPDCEVGKGTVRIRSAGTAITSVTITAAPAGFASALPYDVSFEIGSSGIFSIANLIPGNYTFYATNGCGFSKTITTMVTAYTETVNDFQLFQHCGSFDFFFNHSSNGLASQSFWLQRFNPFTNTWGHPATNVAYEENTVPTELNSMVLTNNVTLYNLPYTGDFRIIKRFETFDNGSTAELKNCIITLKTFTFTGVLEILGLENLTCDGEISDVRVAVNGVPPFNYTITEQNGQPFFIDNGSNDVFANLQAAVYKFEVSDACGFIRTYEFDVALLPSLVVANQPDDYYLCDDNSGDGIEQFTLSTMDDAILGNQVPTDYIVSYYLSADEANSETNPLPNLYSSGNQQIFARVNYINNLNCFAVTDFELKIRDYITLNMNSEFGFCEGSSVTVTADSGYDSYSWSDGQTGNTATFDQPGNYTLTVTKEYGNLICTATHDIEIIQSNAPTISEVIVTDWTDSENMITIILDSNGIGDYEYSIDNIHFQAENTFYGLSTGSYTVYVKDKNGCGPDAIEDVFLLTYPKFFTPNGDGINDFWRIKFSMMEPNMLIYIFDRYGKLITGFGANDHGWDGTLNGYALPSTDYWFLVKRENGKEHRGHFAMKR